MKPDETRILSPAPAGILKDGGSVCVMCDFLTPGVRRALSRMSPGCFIRVERAATLRLLHCQRDKKKAEGYEIGAALLISSSVSLFFSPQRERTSILRLSGGEGELPRWHPSVEHELDLTASRKKTDRT